MSSRAAFALAAWAITAIGAVGAGLAALSALGAGITDRTVSPMTSAQVQAALAEPFTPIPRASASPSPSPTPRPSRTSHPHKASHAPATPRPHAAPAPTRGGRPTGETTRSFSSEGGTVLARCEWNLAYLISWTPMLGYRADDARRGPAIETSVRFESSERKITMIVDCREGRPLVTVETGGHHHHHGGPWEH